MADSVTVIVPTYREAANLRELTERIACVRSDSLHDLELIVVDDDSADGTQELIEELALPWVRLLLRRGERGLGTAVVAGLREARNEFLVVMDADLSHPAEGIPQLIELLKGGADFAIGSRYISGGTMDQRWRVWRRLNSGVATALARPFTRVRDPMSGFFALRRSTFERAAPLNPVGYKIGLELLVKCRCRDVREVPIHFTARSRGESKLTFGQQLSYLRHVGRLLRWRLANRA